MAGTFRLRASSSSSKFHFVLKAGNHEITSLTSQHYESKEEVPRTASRPYGRRRSRSIEHYERKTSKKDEPYFVLKAGNSQVIGTSLIHRQGRHGKRHLASVKKNAPDAAFKDVTAETAAD